MRRVRVLVMGIPAGFLEELDGGAYRFTYDSDYRGIPVSLTMPTTERVHQFDQFPPFFEGLLPEGVMLEALLRRHKLDKKDLFGQLLTVGQDLVGAVTMGELE